MPTMTAALAVAHAASPRMAAWAAQVWALPVLVVCGPPAAVAVAGVPTCLLAAGLAPSAVCMADWAAPAQAHLAAAVVAGPWDAGLMAGPAAVVLCTWAVMALAEAALAPSHQTRLASSRTLAWVVAKAARRRAWVVAGSQGTLRRTTTRKTCVCVQVRGAGRVQS